MNDLEAAMEAGHHIVLKPIYDSESKKITSISDLRQAPPEQVKGFDAITVKTDTSNTTGLGNARTTHDKPAEVLKWNTIPLNLINNSEDSSIDKNLIKEKIDKFNKERPVEVDKINYNKEAGGYHGGRKTKRIRRSKSKRRSTNKARPRTRKAGSRKAGPRKAKR